MSDQAFEFTKSGRIMRMEPGSPRLDREAFSTELAAAIKMEAQEGIPVVWHHNGVECNTDDLARHPDSWAWVCEASSQMAN